MKQKWSGRIEVWGGIECTINRVNDNYFDQLTYSGHYKREHDIETFADLGFKKMRYPILWEKHQPSDVNEIDWTFTENTLLKFQSHNIDIIAGLVHHGSGPDYVNILDSSFVYGLAAYAKKVAEKFPWIKYYTPVNEPLTTARFCGLYGFWYPHTNTDKDFCRILIHECMATVLAMQAIRQINPNAELVQTDDLGKTQSTPLLKYQADFENERRWLTFDLLNGRVNKSHKLWKYLIKNGITADELLFFEENKCPPAVIGVNHYLTSERYLDEKIELFPTHTHGGNSKHRYVDVEAVRVGHITPEGAYKLLKEAWERYGQPLAVTEVHLYCTREEQMRWFASIWNAANQLKEEGVDIRAITAWALLGSFGWDRLLTKEGGNYESGTFDLMGDFLRPTSLAAMIKAYNTQQEYQHPVIEDKGWWERNCRIIYGDEPVSTSTDESSATQPLLIIGQKSMLGDAFTKICTLRGITYRTLGLKEMDITDPDKTRMVISELNPWAVINTAGFFSIDVAEQETGSCFALNTGGPENLAKICNEQGIKFLTFSSDLVFNGLKAMPYTENDQKSPLSVYGMSKALAEDKVIRNHSNALVIRTSASFSPWNNHNFVSQVLKYLNNGKPFEAINDVYISPTYVPDLVNVSLDLLLDDEKGIWHLTNDGQISWSGLAHAVAERKGLDTGLILPKPLQYFKYKANRPLYSVLSSERGNILPSLDNAISRYLEILESN